jgi:WhiB family redox-sensing transcriptional regulator
MCGAGEKAMPSSNGSSSSVMNDHIDPLGTGIAHGRTTTKNPFMHGGPLDLLTVLADTPNLPDAACRGKHQLFDASIGSNVKARQAQRVFAELCASCPVLEQCRDWADTLAPRERQALGVRAG